jgi:hypothetical protein
MYMLAGQFGSSCGHGSLVGSPLGVLVMPGVHVWFCQFSAAAPPSPQEFPHDGGIIIIGAPLPPPATPFGTH